MFFNRHGAITVLVARLLPVVRTFIAFPAGIAKMPQLRFHIYTFVGSWPWCFGLTYVGMKLGQAWQTDPRFLGPDHRPTLSVLLACYREQLAGIGYLNQISAREIAVTNSKNAPMYLMAFFSKNQLGYTFWNRITTQDEKGQMALDW